MKLKTKKLTEKDLKTLRLRHEAVCIVEDIQQLVEKRNKIRREEITLVEKLKNLYRRF